jgi:hypothetical protein
VTCARRPAVAALAGSSACWFFSSTITCCVGPDADGAGAASATPTSPRTPVDTAVAHTSARRRPARDTHPPRQNGNGRPEEAVAHANCREIPADTQKRQRMPMETLCHAVRIDPPGRDRRRSGSPGHVSRGGPAALFGNGLGGDRWALCLAAGRRHAGWTRRRSGCCGCWRPTRVRRPRSTRWPRWPGSRGRPPVPR